MKICVAGAQGRMGRRILALVDAASDMEVGSAFDLGDGEITEGGMTVVLAKDAQDAVSRADLLIDFTVPEATLENVKCATAAGIPCVIGTTGFSDNELTQLREFSKTEPIVLAPNMSVGVNLLFKLTSEVASILGLDYNVEIVETHHNQKKDSPSGTAVRLAERAAEALGLSYSDTVKHGRAGLDGARPRAEIGMHSLRGGDVVGEHTVSFIGQGETLELKHRAHSRDNFAAGALVAARYVYTAKPGLYDMQDVLGLK